MGIEEALAKDLVAVLFVSFTFGGGVLFLIVSTVAENLRKAWADERNAALKRSMIERGFRPDEIVRVLHAGKDPGAA
ncbi:MAG: hypothetical protein JWO38_174 [Gemmataceae bacterium]|nr:hypothetical protein [Gemmataceae bacterium]